MHDGTKQIRTGDQLNSSVRRLDLIQMKGMDILRILSACNNDYIHTISVYQIHTKKRNPEKGLKWVDDKSLFKNDTLYFIF